MSIRKHTIISTNIPGKIVHKMNDHAFWSPDSTNNGSFILARPLENKSIRDGGGLDQDRRLISPVKRQAQIEFQPGILTIRRMRANLRDEVVNIISIHDFSLFFYFKPKSKCTVFLRRENQSIPRSRFQCSYIDIFPRILDFRVESTCRKKK